MVSGIEWLVEAFGCAPTTLRDLAVLGDLFREIVAEMDLCRRYRLPDGEER